MNIINQSHEIIDLPKDQLQQIERIARICYKSEYKTNEISANKFVNMLIKRKHNAMLEFSDITVKFITNRGVSHELVRHRIASFAQESTRYVNYFDKMFFIKPVWLVPDTDDYLCFIKTCETAELIYNKLIKNGRSKQEAREVLPNSLKTEIVVKANVREWRHILNLRCSKYAHPQMRDLMIPLLKELKNKTPILFDDIFVNKI